MAFDSTPHDLITSVLHAGPACSNLVPRLKYLGLGAMARETGTSTIQGTEYRSSTEYIL